MESIALKLDCRDDCHLGILLMGALSTLLIKFYDGRHVRVKNCQQMIAFMTSTNKVWAHGEHINDIE